MYSLKPLYQKFVLFSIKDFFVNKFVNNLQICKQPNMFSPVIEMKHVNYMEMMIDNMLGCQGPSTNIY